MNRLALKDILLTAAAQSDAETKENEHLADLGDTHVGCTGDLCGVTWRPMSENSDHGDDAE